MAPTMGVRRLARLCIVLIAAAIFVVALLSDRPLTVTVLTGVLLAGLVAMEILAPAGLAAPEPGPDPATAPSRRGGPPIVQENLASLGRLASGVAHEFGNPLTTISSIAQLMARRCRDDEFVRKHSESIIEHVNRLSRLSRLMVDLAFPGRPEISTFDLGDALADTIRMARLDQRVGEVDIDLDLPPEGLRIRSDRGAVHLILLNLLLNAADALEGSGRVTVSARVGDLGTEIRVADDGPGIPRPIQGQVFSPFFSTKEPGRGTGLGLSISCRLARAAGGELNIESSGEEGTCFLLALGEPEEAVELPDPRD
jgi:signal transduction histidine kinase